LVWRRFYAALVDDVPRRGDFEAVILAHGRYQTEKALAAALAKRVEFTLADAVGAVESAVRPFAELFPALSALDDPHRALAGAATRARWLAWASAMGREKNLTPQKAAQLIVDAFTVFPDKGADMDALRLLLSALRQAIFVAKEDRLNKNLQKFPAAQAATLELESVCGAVAQHEAWLYQQRMLRLTRVLITEYAALKRERGWVDMPDVERCAQALLSDPVLSGWIQERLDARIRHVLIDEFQDTNPLQWQALMSWLGSYAGAQGSAPSVFFVGDPKQSIYRFRRAEPQVFRAAQGFVRDGLGGDLLSCDHTRRNARAVIAAVNRTMLQSPVATQYEGFRVHTTESLEHGQVLVLPQIPRPARIGSAQPDADTITWRDSLTGVREEPEEGLRVREARQAAHWIAVQVADGVPASEIMVLSRTRAGLQPVVMALRELGVAAQIGEKTVLADCCEVQDVIALVDALVSPQHDLALARALKSPLFGLHDDALVALALRQRAQPRCWLELLQEPWPAGHALAGVGSTLQRWQAWIQALPPHDALQAIYADGDVLAAFARVVPPVMRDAALANLRAMLAAALEFGGGRYASPYGLVRAFKASGVQAPAAVTPDAVRLLTIHGAKGLEAEAVLLLDTDTPKPRAKSMEVLVEWPAEASHPRRFMFLMSESRTPACARAAVDFEEIQRRREELNALYVAMTRARSTLVVSSIEPLSAAAESWWRLLAPVVRAAPLLRSVTPGPEVVGGVFALLELPAAPDAPRPPGNTPLLVGRAEPDSVSSRVGQAMHRLLQWDDMSASAVRAVAREFGLDLQQARTALEMALAIRAGEAAWAFDATQLAWQGNEVEIFFEGSLLRLDRLVRRADKDAWWVLDFKTNSDPLGQPELRAQLELYRRAVQSVHPRADVRAAFLTADGYLIELAIA
ncbi:MAG: UvrD-helicase domain-containing protein, partial [Burkholderiaceae bacterium]